MRMILVFLLSAITWFLGIVFVYYGVPIPALLPENVFLQVASVFAFSMLFFGLTAPFVMLAAGGQQGALIKAAIESQAVDPRLMLAITATFVAAYAATKLGDALLEDLTGKGNFKDALSNGLLLLGIALAIALGASLV